MHDFLSEDTKATLLLCGSFGNEKTEKPLSLGEYARLVHWLKDAKLRPSDLLDKEPRRDASGHADIDANRLDNLFARGLKLGFMVEEWQRSGIWIIGRSDVDYPTRYKIALKDKAPPILFGIGDRGLLQGGGLSIVGSRNVDEAGEHFTRNVAQICVENRMVVVSGGAKGVDQIAMQTALQCGGYVIGIVSDNLLKRSVEAMNRKAIANGSLLLLTPYNPSMPFTAWAAMERNRLIYTMADFGVVVSAELEKGGTWGGATEELKRENGRTIFVRNDANAPSGNAKLMEVGALAWPTAIEQGHLHTQLQNLATQKKQVEKQAQLSLFDFL